MIPWAVQLQELLASPLALVGWIFLGFGAALSFLFVPQTDLTSWYWFRGPIETVVARVDACWDTGASVGGGDGRRGLPVYANEFSFVIYNLNYRGVSYSTGGCGGQGWESRAEFPKGRPDLARLRGGRRAVFGPGVLLVLLMPLFGLALVAEGLRRGLKRLADESATWEELPAAHALAALALPLLTILVSVCLFLRRVLPY